MDLNDCIRKGMIRKISVNDELIKSLIEMSSIKQQTVEEANLNERNISAYVSLAYDSLREILEAACISKGYKVLSHICISILMKDLFEDFDKDELDRMRYIRNGINHYGTRVDFEQGREIIEKIFNIRKKLLVQCLAEFNKKN